MSDSTAEISLRAMLNTYLQNQGSAADLAMLNEKALGLASAMDLSLPSNRVVAVATELAKSHASKLNLGARVTASDFSPWLNERKTTVDMPRSDAYEDLLTQRGWGHGVIRALGKQTDDLVELMGDPTASGAWTRIGLAIGEVQSGKTATYIGALNKALDFGYQIIVVIGGHTEDLRRQTQERLDSDLIGNDTSYSDSLTAAVDTRIGVGKIIPEIATNAMTTVRADFSVKTLRSTGVKLGQGNPTVFVVKKNATVLNSLAKYLQSSQSGGPHTAPLAIIDDESDWASVNTSAKEGDRTAVNKAILSLLDSSTRATYLGITATPFANILIDDDPSTKDLFPKDYIVALESPSNYSGVERYFPTTGSKSEHIRTDIEDFHYLLPQKHKQYAPVTELAESLKTAILTFYLATAIRYKRQSSQPPSSMMVNVSRFNVVQKKFSVLIDEHVESINNQISASMVWFKSPSSPRPPIVTELELVLSQQLPSVEFTLSDLGTELRQVAQDIHVDLVNGLTMKERNDRLSQKSRKQLADWKSRPVIFVGGNILARGLTLDGLVVSYFTRRASAADTLLQMGRWFGYRPGYEDLTRVWMDEDVVEHFVYVSEISRDLRTSVADMRDLNLTPRDFGLRIRMHPEAFLITAANKQRAGIKQTHEGMFSYRGRAFETHVLPAEESANRHNQEITHDLAKTLHTLHGAADDTLANGSAYWRGVPHDTIQKYLSRFNLNKQLPVSRVLGIGDSLPAGIASIGNDRGWTVGFMAGEGGPVPYLDGATLPVLKSLTASIRNNVSLASGSSDLALSRRRVATDTGIANSLTPDERAKALERRRLPGGHSESAPLSQRDAITFGLTQPLLLIYCVAVAEDLDISHPESEMVRGRERLRSIGPAPALVLATPTLTPAEQDLDLQSDGTSFGVKYVVNSVYARLELGIGIETDDDEGESA